MVFGIGRVGSSVVITSGAVGVEGCDSYTSLAVVVGGLIGNGTGVVGMVFTSGGGWDSLVEASLRRHRR